jgi:DNA (cytosine-5)-methyltransferase 1
MRHASFFSGAGGLDIGFERAGIKTVSTCEIDPYASGLLAERFPDAPNLGSITEINANDIPEADIWSGGFPCQDLSVAGKRAGFSGKRSSLAFTFLDLVEQRRPRWLVLENVPGLFSSNNGADFARLLHEMEQLRYGVSWRTLDARYFGVPQRRRRVFIVASLESDRANQVLFECESCGGHPSPGWTQGQGVAGGAQDGSGVIGTIIAGLSHRTGTTQDQLYVGYGKRISGAITARFGKGVNSTIDEPLIISSSPDPDGVREADGLARRLDNPEVVAYQTRVDEKAGNFSINQVDVANSLSALWPADTSHRSMTLVSATDERRVGNFELYDFPKDSVAPTLSALRAKDEMVYGPALSFPSRFGSNATVTEDVAQSFAHSAGAPAVFRKSRRAQTDKDVETWVDDGVANTINLFDLGDVRTTHAVVGSVDDSGADPIGLDNHRYRCCGNGVVANVAEWIGQRLVSADKGWNNG